MFFNEILDLVLNGYFEMIISGILQVRDPLMTEYGEIIATIIGYSGLGLAVFIFPLILIYNICKPISIINDEETQDSYAPLFEGLRLKNKW